MGGTAVVTGKVSDASGHGIAGAHHLVAHVSPTWGGDTAQCTTTLDGPVAAGAKGVEIKLGTGITVSGVVVDGSGKPVPYVSILMDDDPRLHPPTFYSGPPPPPTPKGKYWFGLTDKSGRFRLSGVAPGRHEILARICDGSTVVERGVAAFDVEKKTVSVRIVLEKVK